LFDTPLECRILGREIAVNFSRNAYILSPRRVTFTPTGITWRNLKFEILFFAFVIAALCPAIKDISLGASCT
jgi:hypothetical protein